MHAREDAQIAKECSVEYGAAAACNTSPSIDVNDPSKLNLSPTKQPGSFREYFKENNNLKCDNFL